MCSLKHFELWQTWYLKVIKISEHINQIKRQVFMVFKCHVIQTLDLHVLHEADFPVELCGGCSHGGTGQSWSLLWAGEGGCCTLSSQQPPQPYGAITGVSQRRKQGASWEKQGRWNKLPGKKDSSRATLWFFKRGFIFWRGFRFTVELRRQSRVFMQNSPFISISHYMHLWL